MNPSLTECMIQWEADTILSQVKVGGEVILASSYTEH